jgi:hypothetical protein
VWIKFEVVCRGALWLTKKQRGFPCIPPHRRSKPKTAKNLHQIPACARALDAEPCQPFDGFSDGGSEKQGNLHLWRARSPTALGERSRHLLSEEELVCALRASEKPVERVERFFLPISSRKRFGGFHGLLRAFWQKNAQSTSKGLGKRGIERVFSTTHTS